MERAAALTAGEAGAVTAVSSEVVVVVVVVVVAGVLTAASGSSSRRGSLMEGCPLTRLFTWDRISMT